MPLSLLAAALWLAAPAAAGRAESASPAAASPARGWTAQAAAAPGLKLDLADPQISRALTSALSRSRLAPESLAALPESARAAAVQAALAEVAGKEASEAERALLEGAGASLSSDRDAALLSRLNDLQILTGALPEQRRAQLTYAHRRLRIRMLTNWETRDWLGKEEPGVLGAARGAGKRGLWSLHQLSSSAPLDPILAEEIEPWRAASLASGALRRLSRSDFQDADAFATWLFNLRPESQVAAAEAVLGEAAWRPEHSEHRARLFRVVGAVLKREARAATRAQAAQALAEATAEAERGLLESGEASVFRASGRAAEAYRIALYWDLPVSRVNEIRKTAAERLSALQTRRAAGLLGRRAEIKNLSTKTLTAEDLPRLRALLAAARKPGAEEDPARVLFVCTGNTCRSPLAETLLRGKSKARGLAGIEAYSRGVSAQRGTPMTFDSAVAAREAGVDPSGQVSRPLSSDDVRRADLILAMEPAHLDIVIGRHPEAIAKTFLVNDYAFGAQKAVLDPIAAAPFDRLGLIDKAGSAESTRAYRTTARELEKAVDGLLDEEEALRVLARAEKALSGPAWRRLFERWTARWRRPTAPSAGY